MIHLALVRSDDHNHPISQPHSKVSRLNPSFKLNVGLADKSQSNVSYSLILLMLNSSFSVSQHYQTTSLNYESPVSTIQIECGFSWQNSMECRSTMCM